MRGWLRRVRAAAGAGVLLTALAAVPLACGGPPRDFGLRRLGRPVPDLAVVDGRGHDGVLSEQLGGPLLLHVFASWCAACRWELPALLRLEAEAGIPVVALSIDPSLRRVRAMLGGRIAGNVFRVDEHAVRRELGVSSLPQTFLVDARGHVRARFAGARDWSDAELRQLVRRELGLER